MRWRGLYAARHWWNRKPFDLGMFWEGHRDPAHQPPLSFHTNKARCHQVTDELWGSTLSDAQGTFQPDGLVASHSILDTSGVQCDGYVHLRLLRLTLEPRKPHHR